MADGIFPDEDAGMGTTPRLYTADQIREAVERVDKQDPILDCGCWSSYPKLLLHELGIQEKP